MSVETRATARAAAAGVEVPEQYVTAQQRLSTARLGMWVFLGTEIMLFGALFTAYSTYRSLYPAVFDDASRHLELALGGPNTFVLIISSVTMALAVRAAKTGNRTALSWFLPITAAIGAVFLGLKFLEYYHHYQQHLVPGLGFSYPGANPGPAEIFFYLYFAMTGLHAVHLTIACIMVLALFVLARRGTFSAAYYTPVELIGLYWHFVDIVWIFLLPTFYLIGMHAG